MEVRRTIIVLYVRLRLLVHKSLGGRRNDNDLQPDSLKAFLATAGDVMDGAEFHGKWPYGGSPHLPPATCASARPRRCFPPPCACAHRCRVTARPSRGEGAACKAPGRHMHAALVKWPVAARMVSWVTHSESRPRELRIYVSNQ